MTTFAAESVRVARTVGRPVKAGLARLLAHPAARRVLTRNYTSGRVAFGERNGYRVLAGWLTLDTADADVAHDLRSGRPCPLPDASQSVVYSSHMIEHLDPPSLERFLAEVHRILVPGGWVRLEAPDATKLVRAYARGDDAFFAPFVADNLRLLCHGRGFAPAYGTTHVAFVGSLSSYIEGGIHVPVLCERNEVERRVARMPLDEFGDWCVSLQTAEQYRSGGHINPVHFAKLAALLGACGFTAVRASKVGTTAIPALRLRGIERPHRAFYSLYVEAQKP
jgi:hypothetical protein